MKFLVGTGIGVALLAAVAGALQEGGKKKELKPVDIRGDSFDPACKIKVLEIFTDLKVGETKTMKFEGLPSDSTFEKPAVVSGAAKVTVVDEGVGTNLLTIKVTGVEKSGVNEVQILVKLKCREEKTNKGVGITVKDADGNPKCTVDTIAPPPFIFNTCDPNKAFKPGFNIVGPGPVSERAWDPKSVKLEGPKPIGAKIIRIDNAPPSDIIIWLQYVDPNFSKDVDDHEVSAKGKCGEDTAFGKWRFTVIKISCGIVNPKSQAPLSVPQSGFNVPLPEKEVFKKGEERVVAIFVQGPFEMLGHIQWKIVQTGTVITGPGGATEGNIDILASKDGGRESGTMNPPAKFTIKGVNAGTAEIHVEVGGECAVVCPVKVQK